MTWRYVRMDESEIRSQTRLGEVSQVPVQGSYTYDEVQ